MAAPMNAASPTRSNAILAKENAIKAKLATWNTSNKKSSQTKLNKTVANYAKKKPPKPRMFNQQYSTQVIKGADKGFAKSDYGVGDGAAIPYQIGNQQATVSAKYVPPKAKPKPKPKLPVKPRSVAIGNRLRDLDKTKVKGG